MGTNVGRTDRMVRFAAAAVAVVVAFLVGASSALGIVLFVVAVVLAVTALVGFCPVYRIFGMNTCAVDKS